MVSISTHDNPHACRFILCAKQQGLYGSKELMKSPSRPTTIPMHAHTHARTHARTHAHTHTHTRYCLPSFCHTHIIIFRENHHRSKVLTRSPTEVIFHLSPHACQIIFREDQQSPYRSKVLTRSLTMVSIPTHDNPHYQRRSPESLTVQRCRRGR